MICNTFCGQITMAHREGDELVGRTVAAMGRMRRTAATTVCPISTTAERLLYLLIVIVLCAAPALAKDSVMNRSTTTTTATLVRCNLSEVICAGAAADGIPCHKQTSSYIVDHLEDNSSGGGRDGHGTENEHHIPHRRRADLLGQATTTTTFGTGIRNDILLKSILSHARPTDVNQKCFSDIRILLGALDRSEIWALKALDASGNYNAGFMLGNNHWLGTKALCEHANKPIHINYSARYNRTTDPKLLTATAPFDFHYAIVYVRHSSPNQFEMKVFAESILHIGVCVPRSCAAKEIGNLTAQHFLPANSAAASVEAKRSPLDGNDSNTTCDEVGTPTTIAAALKLHLVAVIHAKLLELPAEFSGKIGYQLLKYLIYATVSLTLGATYCYSGAESGKKSCPKAIENNNQSRGGAAPKCETAESGTNTICQPKATKYLEKGQFAESPNLSDAAAPQMPSLQPIETQWDRILNCFSLTDNFSTVWRSPAISETSSPSLTFIPIIDGIRSICCCLILCFHVSWFMFYTANNPTLFFANAEKFGVSIIASAPILVDVFFAISGFLHCINLLGNERKMEQIRKNTVSQNLKLIGKLLLQRYIRLSIVHLTVVLCAEVGVAYLSHMSPFWIFERNDLTCQKYWWRNVLYIQNLFDANELCVPWSWSVACEMQFYSIFTVGYILYAKRPNLMKKLFVYFAILIGAGSLIISIKFQFQSTFDVLFHTGTALYIAPWSRIHPYMAGTIVGWLICNRESGALAGAAFHKRHRTLSKFLALSVILVFLHASMIRDSHWLLQCVILFVLRCIFGTAAIWLVALSLRGETGLWIDFLSSRFFAHINKLSYSIYLINPLAITMLYGLRTQSSHLEAVNYIQETLGVMVIVYLLALALTVLVEIPLNRVAKLLIK